MRGVVVIYLVVAMFFTIVESEGYHGASFTSIQAENITAPLGNTSLQLNETTGFINPLTTPLSFLTTFMKIVYRSLTFQFEIQGAPDEVIYLIKSFFGILAWLCIYDLAQIFTAMLSGVASLLRSLIPF